MAETAPRYCHWHECDETLTKRQRKFCSRTCSVRGQNRARAREARPKRYTLGTGSRGNGLVVWNSAEERNGDYVTLAHIASDRSIRYREEVPAEVRAYVEHLAFTSEASVSVTQSGSVFTARALGKAVYDQHVDGNHADCRRPECSAPYTMSAAHDQAERQLLAGIRKHFPRATTPVHVHDCSGVRVTVTSPAREGQEQDVTLGVILTATPSGDDYEVQVSDGGTPANRTARSLQDAVNDAVTMLYGRHSRGLL